MTDRTHTEWLTELPEISEKRTVDLDSIYSLANDELGLQQKKRDQIITLYLAMITFFFPFTIELSNVSPFVKGSMFLFLSVIGFILGLIIVRYRIYKEIYWISLRTLGQLKNYNNEQMDKALIQSLYYRSLCKTASSYVHAEKKKIKFFKLAKASFFSAETLYYVLASFVSSAILSASLVFMLSSIPTLPKFLIAFGCGIGTFVLQYFIYIKELAKVYSVAAKPEDKKAFNFGFSKAWHLHFYKTN